MSVEKVTTPELEIAVVDHFGCNQNLIVPNIMQLWLLNYEADLVVVSSASYATEIELKVNRADLKADAKKDHNHDSPNFRRLFFAMPSEIINLDLIPEKAGILSYETITVQEGEYYGGYVEGYQYRRLRLIRNPKSNISAKPLDKGQLQKLRDIGYYRMWKLKRDLNKKTLEVEKLKSQLELMD